MDNTENLMKKVEKFQSETIYISGGITGVPNYMERFDKAEKTLLERGWKNIINPAKINSIYPDGTAWETYMRNSIKLLMDADAIYMLDGWELSNGARVEQYIANIIGIRVLYEM